MGWMDEQAARIGALRDFERRGAWGLVLRKEARTFRVTVGGFGVVLALTPDTGEFLGAVSTRKPPAYAPPVGCYRQWDTSAGGPEADCLPTFSGSRREVGAALVAVESFAAAGGDLEKMLQALGLATGYCGVCGANLTDPLSIARGIGPECIKRVGAWGVREVAKGRSESAEDLRKHTWKARGLADIWTGRREVAG